MRPQYLLLVGAAERDWSEIIERLALRTGLKLAFSQSRVAALVNEDCGCLAIGNQGCVIGTLFHRYGSGEPIASLDAADSTRIAASGGEALLRRFWGGYVAAVAGSGSVRILRDPSATFPCYFAKGPGWIACAPDAELLVESGLCGAEIDWCGLASQLVGAGVPTPVTALKEIHELLPGFLLRVPSELDGQIPCWMPWDHVHGREGGGTEVAQRLSRTIRNCVSGWASGRGRLLVSVSGGLDSSIVSASLVASGAEAVCLTMYGEDPSGDERTYARALCEHLGLRLIERPYRLDQINIAEPLGAHLPRPKDRSQALAYEHAHLQVAREIGADAFVTGNGGDSVFGYSQSAAALADRFLSQGLGRHLLVTLRDICRQTGCSLLDAAADAWRIARGPSAYLCRPDPLFIHPDLLALLPQMAIDHPWLDAPFGVLPGKAAYVASILRVQQSFEPSRSRHLAVLNPLMSQPILEECLAIPSWEWRAGGQDRSLARQAFANDLPPMILRRRLKGGPSHFASQILEFFRGPIRERLLGGRLAREQIIDVVALNEALGEGRPCSSEERVRILEFAAAEAWLDCWSARAASSPISAPPLSQLMSSARPSA